MPMRVGARDMPDECVACGSIEQWNRCHEIPGVIMSDEMGQAGVAENGGDLLGLHREVLGHVHGPIVA